MARRDRMFTVGPQLLDHIGESVDIPAACAGTILLRSARAVDSLTWEIHYRDSYGTHTTCTASTGETCWVVD